MGLGAVSSTAFDTQPPDLPPVMEWIRVSQSFARSPATVGLLSGSCSSARAFAPRFFPAPPRGECYLTLALRYDFTLKLSLMLGTIGIGGTITRPPLPHHRTCGSAYGGSA